MQLGTGDFISNESIEYDDDKATVDNSNNISNNILLNFLHY